MKRRVYLLQIALVLQLSVPCSLAAALKVKEETVEPRRTAAWLPEGYPIPDQEACNSGASLRFCDPDSILSQADMELVGEALKVSPTRKMTLPPKCTLEQSPTNVEVQFAVALLRKVNLTIWLVCRDD